MCIHMYIYQFVSVCTRWVGPFLCKRWSLINHPEVPKIERLSGGSINIVFAVWRDAGFRYPISKYSHWEKQLANVHHCLIDLFFFLLFQIVVCILGQCTHKWWVVTHCHKNILILINQYRVWEDNNVYKICVGRYMYVYIYTLKMKEEII